MTARKPRRKASKYAVAFLATTSLFGMSALSQAPSDGADATRLLEEIKKANARAEDAALSTVSRSSALDDVIELRTTLIEKNTSDRRRATWHADQAEDLLLRRLLFPNDWHTHLLNADAACPLMPPEIPIIVARGIQEATLARVAAVADIRKTEEKGEILDDPAELSLLERLRFEQSLRAPLLEAIGLVLASRADSTAPIRALEILQGLDSAAKDETTGMILRKWHVQALIESGDANGMAKMFDSPDLIENDLDRVRATAVMKGSRSAASLANRRFQLLSDEAFYERLLLGDLRERYLDASLQDKDSASDWSDDRGDLWIAMLETELGKQDWSIDTAIAARLAALSDRLARENQPLAAAWALGNREFARRSQEEGTNPAPREQLAQMLEQADPDTPCRARALWMLAQLSLADGDRLAAALSEEKIYIDHPDSPVANPARVADLVEPWALAGEKEAEARYEKALRASVKRMKDKITATPEQVATQQRRLLQLANHLSRTARGTDARDLYATIDPESPALAGSLIKARAENIHRMHTLDTIEESEVRPSYREIRASLRRYSSRFGSLNPELQEASARVGISEALSSLDLQPRPQDIETIEKVANNEKIDDDLRIEAHFVRHDLRLRNKDTQQDAILRRPDLLLALQLDKELASKVLIERAGILLDEIKEQRAEGNILNADAIVANDLRPIAASIDLEMTRSAPLMDRLTIAQAFLETGKADEALGIWDALAEEEPSAYVVLQGRADALFEIEGEDNLREAMLLYRRLCQGKPDQYVPSEAWWHAQLKQLLVLEKVQRSLDRIAPRIERLRLQDPEFGGPRYRLGFEALLSRRR